MHFKFDSLDWDFELSHLHILSHVFLGGYQKHSSEYHHEKESLKSLISFSPLPSSSSSTGGGGTSPINSETIYCSLFCSDSPPENGGGTGAPGLDTRPGIIGGG